MKLEYSRFRYVNRFYVGVNFTYKGQNINDFYSEYLVVWFGLNGQGGGKAFKVGVSCEEKACTREKKRSRCNFLRKF